MAQIDGVGRDRDARDVAEAHLGAVGRVDPQVAHRVDALAQLRLAAHDDLEDLLLLEEGTDVEALHEDRGGAPDVAGLDVVLPGRLEVHLDLHRRLHGDRPDAGVAHAVDLRHGAAHRLGLAIEDAEVLAEHADRQAVVAPREDAAHPVALVGEDAAANAGIAGDDPADGRERPPVVGGSLHRDPHLARAAAGHLVGGDRAADMAADLAHARERPDLGRGTARDAVHLGQRRARGGIPVDDELAVLERRAQRRVEERQHREPDDDEAGERHQRRPRACGTGGRARRSWPRRRGVRRRAPPTRAAAGSTAPARARA